MQVRVAKRAKREKAQSKGNVAKAKVGFGDFWMLSFKRREEGVDAGRWRFTENVDNIDMDRLLSFGMYY